MALQGPFLVVADSPAPDVVDALRAAGAFPIVEADWPDAAAAVASVEPAGVVLAEPCSDGERASEHAQALADKLKSGSGPFTPVIARLRDDGASLVPDALAMSASAPAAAIARRLAAASRIRALHGTVLRRTETLGLARRAGSRHADQRSARGSDRAGRRPRPLLSGSHGRRRRARRPGRRTQRRERGARAQRPRHRRHGGRRRFQPARGRGAVDRARRGRALSRPAGRRARRPAQHRRGVLRAAAQSRTHRRRPRPPGRALSALRAPACLRPAAQAHAQIARRQRHDRSRAPGCSPTKYSGAISTAPSTMPKSAASGCRSRASPSSAATAASASMPRGWSAG